MRKSTRALLGLIAIEALLLSGTAYMIAQTRSGAWTTANPSEAVKSMTQVAGGAMGIVAVVLVLAFFRHRRNGN